MSSLGRRVPTDWKHYEKYPLEMAPFVPTPGAFAINWYTNFDRPQKIGTQWWIGRGDLGTIRGGHCICAKPIGIADSVGWWDFYNQGAEGACVGFAESRVMSLLRRERFNAGWLYHEAQLVDEWADTPPAEGTSARAGFQILETKGGERVYRGVSQPPDLANGISAYRWASSWDVVRATLGVPLGMDGIRLLNSWGRQYPHIVNLTDEAGARLLAEDGEFGIPTPR